jgi:hypothetical protein
MLFVPKPSKQHKGGNFVRGMLKIFGVPEHL